MGRLELILLMLISMLAGCQLYSRVKGHKGVSLALIAVIILILDFLVSRSVEGKSQPGLLKFLWVRIALIALVPLIVVGGCSIHSCVGSALIGTGILVIVLGLHDKELTGN